MPGSPLPATSRSSTTTSGCTQPSATARPLKHSQSSKLQQPLHDQQPEKLSKTLTQLTGIWRRGASRVSCTPGFVCAVAPGGGCCGEVTWSACFQGVHGLTWGGGP